MSTHSPPRAACCGGLLPGDGPDAEVCSCGASWGVAPFPRPDLTSQEWEWVFGLVSLRAGERCEVCGESLRDVPRSRVSLHHRRPRGMGGDTRPDVHSLANLLLVHGSGTAGCHWLLEERWRGEARRRGLLVDKSGERSDPARVEVTLWSGRRVLLDPISPVYLPPGDGLAYAV